MGFDMWVSWINPWPRWEYSSSEQGEHYMHIYRTLEPGPPMTVICILSALEEESRPPA